MSLKYFQLIHTHTHTQAIPLYMAHIDIYSGKMFPGYKYLQNTKNKDILISYELYVNF